MAKKKWTKELSLKFVELSKYFDISQLAKAFKLKKDTAYQRLVFAKKLLEPEPEEVDISKLDYKFVQDYENMCNFEQTKQKMIDKKFRKKLLSIKIFED